MPPPAVPSASRVSGVLFQSLPDGAPLRLEFSTQVLEPSEFHFHARSVPYAELQALLAADLVPLQVLVYRIPPSLLNPGYWEPWTSEAEEAVRARMKGAITRSTGRAMELWRADAIAPGRHLRDDLQDVPVELVLGTVIRTSGDGLIRLGEAWTSTAPAATDRYQWVAFTGLPAGERLSALAQAGHDDLTAFRLTLPEARAACAATGDGRTRLMLRSHDLLRRLVRAALRGFLIRASGTVVAPPGDRVVDQLIRLADGQGLFSSGDHDFLNKIRTFEVTIHVGGTAWDEPAAPTDGGPSDEERVLVYYDRSSGIWAVAR